MAKAKMFDSIEWEDSKTGIPLAGTVQRVLENSVIVSIAGTDDSTVVSHKRYRVKEVNNNEG